MCSPRAVPLRQQAIHPHSHTDIHRHRQPHTETHTMQVLLIDSALTWCIYASACYCACVCVREIVWCCMLLGAAAAAMICLAEADAAVAAAAGVTATTTSTSTSTCHKYQYKRGEVAASGVKVEGREDGKGEEEPAKYSSCEVATQDKRDRARTRHCILAESVLNTFRTYLKCCSFPLPFPFPTLFLLHSPPLLALPLQCALSSATLFLHDLPHGYSSICRSQRNLHIIYNGQTFKASFTPAGQIHPLHRTHTHTQTHQHTRKHTKHFSAPLMMTPCWESTCCRRCWRRSGQKIFLKFLT